MKNLTLLISAVLLNSHVIFTELPAAAKMADTSAGAKTLEQEAKKEKRCEILMRLVNKNNPILNSWLKQGQTWDIKKLHENYAKLYQEVQTCETKRLQKLHSSSRSELASPTVLLLQNNLKEIEERLEELKAADEIDLRDEFLRIKKSSCNCTCYHDAGGDDY